MADFEAEYADAMRTYVERGGEHALHRAYELGRRALDEGVTILAMQRFHGDVLLGLLQGVSAGNHSRAVAGASQFFSEFLSPFDMTFRGSLEMLATLKSEIADRQRAEEALQQSERYHKSLIENSLDIVTILDGAGTIRYTSPSGERVLGYSRDEIIGRNVLEFLHPDDVDVFLELCSVPGEVHGQAVTNEVRVRHKDGGWVFLESISKNLVDDPCVRGIIINSRDTTERRNLEEIRRRYEFIVNAAKEFMLLVNTRSEIEAVNVACGAVLQRDRKEIVGSALQQILGDVAFTSLFKERLERCFTGVEVSDEGWFTFPGWGTRYLEIDCYPYRNDVSAVTHAIVIMRDATNRRTTEERIRETQRQRAEDMRMYAHLIQRAQEDERKRISRELHDDICQRLTALKLRMNVLDSRGQNRSDTVARALQAIKEEIDGLINEARRISYNLRPLALDHFGLATALRMLCGEYAKNNGMEIGFHTNLTFHRRYDAEAETALFRVAQEALSNCVKHAGVREANLTAMDADGRITISVTDHGRGFDYANYVIHSVPDRHFGLINMRERMELCGGTFAVESSAGKGTTVMVTLPVGKGESGGEDQTAVRG